MLLVIGIMFAELGATTVAEVIAFTFAQMLAPILKAIKARIQPVIAADQTPRLAVIK
jgi:hypothetical protein